MGMGVHCMNILIIAGVWLQSGAQWRSAGWCWAEVAWSTVGGDTSQCVLGNTPGDTNY